MRETIQSCPEPSKVGHIIYIVHTLQVQDLIKNSLNTIEQDIGHKVETVILYESAFHTEAIRRRF